MSLETNRAAWLQGGKAACHVTEPYPERSYRMLLMGAPGTGKGTQAELLCERFGMCHLSTGDIFRAARCADAATISPAMQRAVGCMQRGELVPDDLVIDLVRERMTCIKCNYGFLFDGFPRTVAQAEALDGLFQSAAIAVDAVISYELPTDVIIERLSGRRTCKGCGTSYHVRTKPPRRTDCCDHCNGALFQRVDDQPATIQVRLEEYHNTAEPLRAYYERQNLLVPISASGSPQEVFDLTMNALRSVLV